MSNVLNTNPKLTIGMATYDDFDGAYFSIQAIHMYHPKVLPDCEILVVDNHPESAAGKAIKELAKWVPIRYVAFQELSGTAAKDMVFREARGRFVLCMDCHVLFPPGTLSRLPRYFEEHPDTPDLLQGPLLTDNLRMRCTHYRPKWHHSGLGYRQRTPEGRIPKPNRLKLSFRAWESSRAANQRGMA